MPGTSAVCFASLDGQHLVEAPIGHVGTQAGLTPAWVERAAWHNSLVVTFTAPHPPAPALALSPQGAGTPHTDSIGFGLCRNYGGDKAEHTGVNPVIVLKYHVICTRNRFYVTDR